ncbi:Putative SbcC-like dsDNA exonuclease (plasmid) [Pseudorhizobium banfieldiae]|uniref:Putative SbcC-like dsDNA exonuclease n=1 Tax=Pseudorhizobium banfieldiae TaxID=1125847 RepID=L0NNB0_9HYPH|nr:SMC family ATPase [Pseudorhizobium banfieldiae]CAD6629269.1 SMC family ATPase [arsenite-oxidising bacterium NT-25]CCF22341.1 Putative SbcC-like dsDNA exonuclease [Pseudorhizobium banfieldiae]
MRPIRLSLQAFGPFATTEIVDFRSALETGLFGIYGQTGAGKSRLFSAMSFALFGAPTKTDQEPRSLRSDHSAPDLPTEVEFVFELGAKTYLIRRRPAQERPKARGEGTTEDAAEASLFDVTGIPVDTLGPSQSGRVIAEKKVSLVGQHIEQLLGYGADQFRQIVLLPQGKFETFLAAKTDARVEILRDLFDVKIYRDLAARLKEEASEAERALRDQRALYVARLEERGFESAEALELGIAAAEAKVEEKQGIQQGAETKAETARIALTEGEQIERAFVAVDTARKALDNLEAKTGELEELAKRIEAVGNALQARDLEAAWRDAEQESRNGVEAVTMAEAELNIANGAKKQTAQKLVEAQLGEERRQQVQADLTRLEAIENQVGQAADLRSAFDDAAKDEASAKKALAEAADTRENLKSQRDATDLALEQARKTEASRGKLTGELADVSRERIKAVAHAKAQKAVAEAERKVEAASDELATKAEAAKVADAALVDAEARLSRTQAIILAEKLIEGTPCPVCGSQDHPTPAHGTPEQSGLTEAFRIAQVQARNTAEAKVRAESELGNFRTRLDEMKRALEEQERPERTLAELEAEIARLEGDVATLGKAVDLDAMAEQLAKLKRKVTEAETAEATARTAAGKAETALAGARAKLDTVIEALPEGLRTPEAVVARREALQREQRQLSEAVAVATQQDRAASEALTRAQEQLEAAKRARDAQQQRVLKAQGDFGARLAEVGLDKAGYDACKAHFPTLDADRKKVTDHRDGLIAARTTLQNATAACADRERPDLAPLQLALDNATQELNAANDALSTARTDVSSLTKFTESLAEALAKTERLESETGPLRGLADLANGKNDFKMTLETFAIGAMFDQVLEAANMRLEPMTRGRYRLTRGLEASGGRGKRGLEIEVFDINTGKARPTVTLSGGETFIAALALALGLADVVESLSGKIRMDTIFIDEGFGSLDTENGAGTLDQVIQVLAALTEGSRAVGLISHVGLVQEAIPQGFYVRSTPSGSRVEERRGLG